MRRKCEPPARYQPERGGTGYIGVQGGDSGRYNASQRQNREAPVARRIEARVEPPSDGVGEEAAVRLL